jgi:phenylalanyl-tRNA synthetase alpha subunit
VGQLENKSENSTDMSREDIRIARDENLSENLSEEQKNDFELSNNSSVAPPVHLKDTKRSLTRSKRSKKPLVAKEVKKRVANSLTDYKEACKEKHSTDKLKLKEYNTKISKGTITDKEKKARLNLIRQINSRNYRVQNKELISKLKGVIESISVIADKHNITEI